MGHLEEGFGKPIDRTGELISFYIKLDPSVQALILEQVKATAAKYSKAKLVFPDDDLPKDI